MGTDCEAPEFYRASDASGVSIHTAAATHKLRTIISDRNLMQRRTGGQGQRDRCRALPRTCAIRAGVLRRGARGTEAPFPCRPASCPFHCSSRCAHDAGRTFRWTGNQARNTAGRGPRRDALDQSVLRGVRSRTGFGFGGSGGGGRSLPHLAQYVSCARFRPVHLQTQIIDHDLARGIQQPAVAPTAAAAMTIHHGSPMND